MPKESGKDIITRSKKDSLEQELKELKEVKRLETIEQLKVARSYGDLSENSEYDVAREKQAGIESRISEIEAILRNAEVVDEDHAVESVTIGNSVEVEIDGKDKKVFDIGTKAGNIEISPYAPVAEGLIGGKVGEVLSIDLPKGQVKMRIIAIT